MKRGLGMSELMVLAIPTVGAGGMECERSGHFGHCDTFTVVEIGGDAAMSVRIVENPPHVEGGCLAPVNLLQSHGVTAIVVAGMGARPLAGFESVGINVFFENETPVVGDVVTKVLAGQCEVMDARFVCGGH